MQGQTRASTLRALLQRPGGIVVPGAYDPLCARLALSAGFEALYVSGSATSATRAALPDIGLITQTEVASLVHAIHEAVPLPLIVDADTGFGGVLNAMRTVRELEMAGAAAIHIEDQVAQKRCGHLDGKRLVDSDEMEGKIRAAVASRRDPNFVVIARTDAREVEGMERALQRARRYVAAGADVVFPEALHDEQEFRTFAKALDVPLLANMTEFGKTPYYRADQFFDWGYKIVLFPASALRVSLQAVYAFLTDLRKTGTQEPWAGRMMTRKELYQHIDYTRYEELERAFWPPQENNSKGT